MNQPTLQKLKQAHLAPALFLFTMIFGSIGLDQLSKVQSEAQLMTWQDAEDTTLYRGRRVQLLSFGVPNQERDFYLAFSVNYVRNPGAAWGVLQGLDDNIRKPFFYAVTFVAVIVIGLYLRSTPPSHRLAIYALSLILSGAVGNFIDRLRLGYVIDWIDVRWNLLGWRYDFPNFNIADSAISVGVTFLLIDILFLENARRKAGSSPVLAKKQKFA